MYRCWDFSVALTQNRVHNGRNAAPTPHNVLCQYTESKTSLSWTGHTERGIGERQLRELPYVVEAVLSY